MNRPGSVFLTLALLLSLTGFSAAQESPTNGWERFLRENVTFSGFLDNTTGLSISHGDRHFNTSNRFIMNRFTFQPEFNIQPRDDIKLFISWRFVKEPRYAAEGKSREKTVRNAPPLTGPPIAAPVQPLDNTFYDEDSPKPWEMIWDIKPTDLLQIRLGRQFISWGETDGLRLLDVINPQDLTFSPPAAPNLFDLDETRIPSWGLRMLYNVRPVSNSVFEFFALPGFDEAKQRVDEVLGSNDTADGIVRYGRWSAHPETRLVLGAFNAFGNLFASPIRANAPAIIPSVTRQLPDGGDAWKIGSRITHNVGKLNLGLGYIWGFNPQGSDMVFKLKGSSLLGACAATPPFVPCPTVARIRLVNDRTSIFAGHFNYPVEDVAGVPVNTAVRGEVALYPSKPYNISKFPGPFGLRAGPHPRHLDTALTEKNTLRYSLGFDRTTLIPFLQDDPWRPFRMSLQVFQSIILNHEDGIRVFSTAEKTKQVSSILTFRVSTGYLGDTILPDLFLGYDPDGYWSANPAVTYAPPWNEKLKFTLVAALYGGHNKFKSFGFFDEKDSIFLKMRYQF